MDELEKLFHDWAMLAAPQPFSAALSPFDERRATLGDMASLQVELVVHSPKKKMWTVTILSSNHNDWENMMGSVDCPSSHRSLWMAFKHSLCLTLHELHGEKSEYSRPLRGMLKRAFNVMNKAHRQK